MRELNTPRARGHIGLPVAVDRGNARHSRQPAIWQAAAWRQCWSVSEEAAILISRPHWTVGRFPARCSTHRARAVAARSSCLATSAHLDDTAYCERRPAGGLGEGHIEQTSIAARRQAARGPSRSQTWLFEAVLASAPTALVLADTRSYGLTRYLRNLRIGDPHFGECPRH